MQAGAVCIGAIVILFIYDWRMALIIIVVIAPQVAATRVSSHYLMNYMVQYQKAKGDMSNIGTESLSNIRTVKAFGDEEMTCLKFEKAS